MDAAVKRNEEIKSHVLSNLPTEHLRDNGPDYEPEEISQQIVENEKSKSPEPVKIGAGIPKAIGEVNTDDDIKESPKTPKRLPDGIQDDEKAHLELPHAPLPWEEIKAHVAEKRNELTFEKPAAGADPVESEKVFWEVDEKAGKSPVLQEKLKSGDSNGLTWDEPEKQIHAAELGPVPTYNAKGLERIVHLDFKGKLRFFGRFRYFEFFPAVRIMQSLRCAIEIGISYTIISKTQRMGSNRRFDRI